MAYIYNLHNFVVVESDVDLGLRYFECKGTPKAADLVVRIVDYRPIDNKRYQRIASGLYYSEAEDSVLSSLSILGLKVSWEIRGILSRRTELRVSRSYVALSKHVLIFPISSVHQLICLVRMVLQIKMLLKNCSFLVGGCVHLDGLNIIFAGTGGSGKTLSTISFAEAYNADFMSDDLMILNKKILYSYPSLLKLRKFNLDFVSYSTHVDPVRRFHDRVRNKANGQSDIYLLELSQATYLRGISASEGINKLCNLNNKALLYFNERMLSSLPYIYDQLSLLNLQQRQFEIIVESFANARFRVISAPQTKDYLKMLEEYYGPAGRS